AAKSRPDLYAWVWYARCDDRGDQLADARYFTERLARLTARVGFGDLLLQIFNPLLELLDLPPQNFYRHHGCAWERRVLFREFEKLRLGQCPWLRQCRTRLNGYVPHLRSSSAA